MTKQKQKQKEPEQKAAPAPAPVTWKAAPAPTPTEPSIYVGPTLQGGRLVRYTVFRDGVATPHIAAMVQEHPVLKRLIIPVSKLAAFDGRLSDRSSVEAALFKEASTIFKKEG